MRKYVEDEVCPGCGVRRRKYERGHWMRELQDIPRGQHKVLVATFWHPHCRATAKKANP